MVQSHHFSATAQLEQKMRLTRHAGHTAPALAGTRAATLLRGGDALYKPVIHARIESTDSSFLILILILIRIPIHIDILPSQDLYSVYKSASSMNRRVIQPSSIDEFHKDNSAKQSLNSQTCLLNSICSKSYNHLYVVQPNMKHSLLCMRSARLALHATRGYARGLWPDILQNWGTCTCVCLGMVWGTCPG